MNGGDAAMIDGSEELSLAFEPLHALGIRRDRPRQNLDRNVSTQARVTRAIDLAHAAGAKRRDDLVRPDAIPGCERHGAIMPRRERAGAARMSAYRP